MNANTISFYCEDCRVDQDLIPGKRVNGNAQWFFAECKECEKGLIRYITDKGLDPYYRNSLYLKKQRLKFAKDLIQPGDPRFKTYYKDEWDKLELASQRHDERLKAEKKDRDSYYTKFKDETSNVKKMVRNVLDVEQKM